ncbi:MAG: hypothetical protein IIA67_10120, partial [Planctomycetes bacterium]|nr:hypothetical protein [Planctomycetota bacterium]
MNAYPAHGPIALRSLRIESLEPRHLLSTSAMTFADDFNRPDAETLGPDWLEVAGGFDLLDRRAEVVTDSATAQILAADQTHVRAEAFVDVTAGETAGLIVRYTNDGGPTGYVGQIVLSAGAVTAQIIRLVDGQETVLSSTPVATTAGTLRLEVLEQARDWYFDGKQVGH